MKAKLAFTAGLAVGYVVGTRVGRRGYENLKKNARAVWKMDAVQETVHHAETTVKDEAEKIGARLLHPAVANSPVAPSSAEAAYGRHGALPDVDSDPTLTDALGQDWADDGGALPSGPAA